MIPANPCRSVILAGASCRALARSFVRAGFSPICFDLFADADLAAIARVKPIELAQWPFGILPHLNPLAGIPFAFTGGLENHPVFLDEVAKGHLLWGNCPQVYQSVRDPFFLANTLPPLGIAFPEVIATGNRPTEESDWLLKPLAGSGGIGIRHLRKGSSIPMGYYSQKFIPGEDVSFSYLLAQKEPALLMVSRGLPFAKLLGAPGMGYSGNHLPGSQWQPCEPALTQSLGKFLWEQGLRGLVGVDGRLDDQGHLFVLEVNPRYTASMELGERSRNTPFAKLHADCFGGASREDGPPNPITQAGFLAEPDGIPRTKAILYARSEFRLSPDIDWPERFTSLEQKHKIELCDLPTAGSIVAKGAPILTIIEMGTSWTDLKDRFEPLVEDLRNQVEDLRIQVESLQNQLEHL